MTWLFSIFILHMSASIQALLYVVARGNVDVTRLLKLQQHRRRARETYKTGINILCTVLPRGEMCECRWIPSAHSTERSSRQATLLRCRRRAELSSRLLCRLSDGRVESLCGAVCRARAGRIPLPRDAVAALGAPWAGVRCVEPGVSSDMACAHVADISNGS